MPVHAGAALCCTAAPEADGDRGKESKEIKGVQGGVHVLRRMLVDSDFDRWALTRLRRWKRNIKWKELPCPPPFVDSGQLRVGVGHANAAHLSACPFRGCRTARCLLHTLEGLSLVSRSHTCLRACASNGCTPAPQPFLEAHSGSPSLLPSVLLSPLPSSSTPLCCFPCPLFLLPSLFQPQLFLPALSCVLRLRLVCELRAC